MKRISDLFNTNQAKNELSGDRITVGVATCGISAGAVPTLELLKDANLGVLVELVGCSGMCYNEPIVVARKNGVSSIYSHVVAEKAY